MESKYENARQGSHCKAEPIRRTSRDEDEDLDDLHSSGGSSSTTEVDESLLGEKWHKSRGHSVEDEDYMDDLEAHGQAQSRLSRSASSDSSTSPRQRQRRSWRRAATCVHWGLDTLLLLAILGLLVRQQMGQQKDAARWDFGGDFTGVGPARISQQIKRFKSDQSYAPMNSSEFFTEEVLQRWNQLMPVGMGFQWVNDTHRYHDLPTPIEWPDKTVFTTSVTHQIHCLYTIAQTYSGLKANYPIPDDHHWHMIHCMDYMREAVMCSADIALEGHETTFPDDNGGSDGWDSKHICKDYSQVKTYLESVRAYDDQLIY